MKKLSQRVISIIISILILASSLGCVIGVFADTQQISYNGNNLLKGLIPSAFAPTAQGQIWYKWGMIRTENTDTNKIWGYDLLQPDHTGAYNDDKIAYLTPLTDGKTDKSLWIQPENAWDLNDVTKYDDMYIVYELSEKANLSGFSFDATGAFATKNVDVYAAGTYADLYKNKVATISTNDDIVSGTISTVASKYVAFVLKTPGYFVSEIEVFGAPLGDSVIAGKYASAYAPTARTSDKIWYKWGMIRVEDNDTNKMWGWDLLQPDHTAAFNDTNKAHIAKLTDNNADTTILLKPENCWDKTTNAGYDNMYIVYELDDKTNLEGFSVNTSSIASKTVDVYAASTYADLYNSKVATVATESKDMSAKISTIASKYVAFVFTTPDYYVSGIEVYGEKTNPNVVAGKLPSAIAPTTQGTIWYKWNMLRDENGGETLWGYDLLQPDHQAAADGAIKNYTPKLTDGNADTTMLLKPQFCYDKTVPDSYHDIYIVYELGDEANLEGVLINTTSTASKSVDIYAAGNYADLYKNKVATATTENKNISVAVSTIATKFVAFVFKTPDCFVSEIEVYGNKVSNVASGLIPSAFAPTAQGQIWYKWGMIRTENTDTNKIWGYDLLQPDHTGAYNDDKIAYLTPLTDGKTDKSLWIQPENAWDLNDVTKYDDMYIVYELSEKANLSGFEFKMGAGGVSSTKTVDVYAAGTYADLYKNKVTTITTDTQNIVGTLSTVETKFIAFVLKTPGYFVSEISVYSSEEGDLEPDITFTQPNLAKGKMPIVYTSSNVGGNGYNWTETNVAPGGPAKFGYSIPIKEGITGVDTWKEYLTKLTDDNLQTSQWVQPIHSTQDFVIVYELDKSTALEGFMLDAKNGSVNGTVYASENYADLFSAGKIVAQLNKSGAAVCIKALTNVTAKYVAFVLNAPACYINEIAIYGAPDTAQAVTFTSENAIKGKMPIVYSSANSGGYSYNWTETRTSPDPNNPRLKFGYSVPINEPQGEAAQQTTINSWKDRLLKLTDENSLTGQWVQPARIVNPYDDFVIVYQLDELKTLEGFKFDSLCKDVRVKLYAAKTYNALFSQRNLISEFTVDEYIGSVSKKVECAAEYVALVFDKPAFVLTEFAVYAKDYVKPDYGTNLILNKDPMSIFVANREYPIGSNGARLWASDAETGRVNEMSLISETMGWFTDDDFTKHKDWLHDGAQKYVNNKSYYKVLAYDFGSVSTLNKILVDSNMGGYDIYVSEKFNDLYKSTSRVYSSGGDQLLPNGELDPATDLDYGENLIDVAGVTGRYMAIVITRANRQNVECYDAIAIREIQAYGTPGTVYTGDNLISGKTPIFINRADYGAYDVQLETYQVQGGGAKAYTDGEYTTGGTVQFPNSGGTLVYRNGALVMTYYLEGTCDVEAFAMHSGYYYGPGGVDLYVSERFDTLFDDESCVFTSGGETADDDGIYDVSKNLGTGTLSIKLDAPKRGRYAAFVFTRIYDIGVIGASGILRVAEIELFGKQHSTEQLPTTTITDSATGNKATFNYQNPDDTFIFADKGIASFRMAKVSDIDLKSNRFANILLQNRFKAISDAFKLEFLDKDGKVIPVSKLEGENITFEYALSSDKMVRLGEIRKDSVYVIRDAQQYENKMKLTSEELSGYTFVLLEALSGEDLKYNGIVIDTTPTLDDNDQTSAGTTDNTVGTAGNTNGSIVDNNTQANNNAQADNNTVGENTDNANKPNKKPAGSNKQWVEVEDPLEWFWNIYDTFTANIWMLILCIVALVACIGGIVAQIIFYKKRRKN